MHAMPLRALLILLLHLPHALTAFNQTAFSRLPHAQKLLSETMCLFQSEGSICDRGAGPARPKTMLTGLQDAKKSATAGCDASMCYHGAYMIPYLIERYRAKSLAELGVCTGMSTVSVMARYAANGVPHDAPASSQREPLSKYYAVDPWGGMKCKPGCACTKQIKQLAKTWPNVLEPLKGYSVPMASHVPNGTLDLVYVDAAHDYRNVRDDVIAWWPKLAAHGVMAGHDFAHWRNWAEARRRRTATRKGDDAETKAAQVECDM